MISVALKSQPIRYVLLSLSIAAASGQFLNTPGDNVDAATLGAMFRAARGAI
jgi:hypothetical protein